MSCVCSGAMRDSVAFPLSTLVQSLRDNILIPEFWICGGTAYSGADGIVTSWSCSVLNDAEVGIQRDSFNFYHRSLRIHVEQAFCVLVKSLGYLTKGFLLFYMVENMPSVAGVHPPA